MTDQVNGRRHLWAWVAGVCGSILVAGVISVLASIQGAQVATSVLSARLDGLAQQVRDLREEVELLRRRIDK